MARKNANSMVIPKSAKWVGRFYIKKKAGANGIAGAGQEVGLGGFVLPPFSVPVRYWASWGVCGQAAAGFIYQRSLFRISFRSTDIPDHQEMQESATDVTIDTMIGRYLPITQNPYELDDTLETDSGLPGDTENVTAQYRRQKFIEREVELGLPEHAFLAADNSMFYAYQDAQRGHFPSKHLSFDKGKFIGWSALQDEPIASSDDAAIMWGEQPDLQDLYGTLLSEVAGDAGVIQALTGQGMSSNLMRYLNQAETVSGHHEAENLSVFTNLTVQCELYEPAAGAGRILTPG